MSANKILKQLLSQLNENKTTAAVRPKDYFTTKEWASKLGVSRSYASEIILEGTKQGIFEVITIPINVGCFVRATRLFKKVK